MDHEYFRHNVDEAMNILQGRCRDNLTNVEFSSNECAYAASVIQEQEHQHEKDAVGKHRKYFASNINEAKKNATACAAEVNISYADNIQCGRALVVVGEYFQQFGEEKNKISYKESFRNDLESARKKIAQGCVDDDLECSSAQEIVAEADFVMVRDKLIDKLRKTITKQGNNDKTFSAIEKSKFEDYKKHFSQNKSDAENVTIVCINNDKKKLRNNPECAAATEALLEILLQNKDADEKNKTKEIDMSLEIQERLAENPSEVEKLLNGRCKDIIADSLFKLDHDLEDKECNAALIINNRNLIDSQEKKHVRKHKLVKDRAYFNGNIKEAEKISTQCKEGIVNDINECDLSISLVNERNLEENKRIDYQVYYNSHPMAAKFQMKWCKSTMLIFNIKCQTAENAIKFHADKKPKIYSEEVLLQNIQKLKGDFSKVKEILNGKCKSLMEDSWYFLDESLRDEECDAAAEIAKAAIEQKDRHN
jgi:hypothetical protein